MTGKADPAYMPDWVRDDAGNLVPPLTPTAAEAARVEGSRIAREKAALDGHNASVGEQKREEKRGRRR